jgi:hypothetical protein
MIGASIDKLGAGRTDAALDNPDHSADVQSTAQQSMLGLGRWQINYKIIKTKINNE